MDGPEATIEELATGGVERLAGAHARRWTGFWIGLLGAVVGIAALGPPSGGKPGGAQVSHPSGDFSRSANPGSAGTQRLVAIAGPVTGAVETSGTVTVAGSNSGEATSLMLTVRLGDLIVGRQAIAIEPGQPFAIRVPVATPIDGLVLPATFTVADEKDGRVLSSGSLEIAGPPVTAWIRASTADWTIVEGVAPAAAGHIVVVPSGDCGARARPVEAWIGDPRVAIADARDALLAFGRIAWRAILPPCEPAPMIVVRWSGVGGERGELYETLTPLIANPPAARPARDAQPRAPS